MKYNIIKEENVKSNGRNNIVVYLEGFGNERFRGRVEAIIVKGSMILLSMNKDGSYSVPGGGWEPMEDHGAACIREVQEEVRITCNDAKYIDSYIYQLDEPKGWVKKSIPKNKQWKSYYNEVFLCKYSEEYKGYIDPVDRDNIINTAKWYNINSVYNMLKEEHKKAIDVYRGKSLSTNESYIINEKDIYYNKDKFNSGEINLCFITGHSGSGKSTMGKKLEDEGVEWIQLDDLQCIADRFTMDNLKEYGDLIYSYFNGEGKKFYVTQKYLVDNKIPGSEYEDKLYPGFVHYAMKYAKSHKDKKFVLEGVWFFCSGEDKKAWFKPEEFKDYAFYIKGTSMLISKYRAAKRDAKNDSDNKKEEGKAFRNNFFKKNWKWYFIDEKRIKVFRDYFKNKSINESVSSSLDANYISKGKKNLSSFKKVHITETIINKYKKEYPFLKHVRCKDTDQYICDGYIWFDNDKLAAMVGSCLYTDDKTKWIVSLEIIKDYRGYGLSKQILDFATKTMNCKYLSVNKNNKIAKKVYDDYGFKVYHESDTMYYMTIDKNCTINESVEHNPKLYFISTKENIKYLIPRIPDNFFTRNGYEDNKTPRVCFSTDIGKCLMALSNKCTGQKYYVYQPIGKYNVISPTKKQVPDVEITDEKWICEKVKLSCIGKILCIGDKGEDGISYTYGHNNEYKAELYEWNWEWIEKY